jgi:hypothetical protein
MPAMPALRPGPGRRADTAARRPSPPRLCVLIQPLAAGLALQPGSHALDAVWITSTQAGQQIAVSARPRPATAAKLTFRGCSAGQGSTRTCTIRSPLPGQNAELVLRAAIRSVREPGRITITVTATAPGRPGSRPAITVRSSIITPVSASPAQATPEPATPAPTPSAPPVLPGAPVAASGGVTTPATIAAPGSSPAVPSAAQPATAPAPVPRNELASDSRPAWQHASPAGSALALAGLAVIIIATAAGPITRKTNSRRNRSPAQDPP